MAHDSDSMAEPEILVVGETLIDFVPDRPGQLGHVESFSRRTGGAPANVAIRLTALGQTPWFWTRLSTDSFGAFLNETLKQYGIPERFVTRDRDAATTLAFVGHDENADRSFSFYRNRTADTRMETGVVPDEVLESIECVYIGGVVLASEPSRGAILDLIEQASAADCTIYFDPNYRPELWDIKEFETTVKEVIGNVDIIKATREELASCEFKSDTREKVCQIVCEAGPHTVLMTLGKEGAYAYCDERSSWQSGSYERPGFDVEAVDTTGAGDAFVAGTISSVVEGESIEKCLDTSNAMAALSTTSEGAVENLPSREDTEAFLELRGRSR